MSANVAGRLVERASRHPERDAIVQYGVRGARRIGFAELAERVSRLSEGMQRRGVGPGSRVLLFVPMSIELYVALLGTLHAGATAVLVDAWADRRRLDAAVEAARPDLFIGTPRAQLLRLVSPAVRRIARHWVAGPGALSLRRYEGARVGEVVEVAADHPALITLTTGSTGRPKAAARSHGFLWAQHEALADHLGLRASDVDMPTLPVFVLNNLALGVTSVIPHFDPRRPADIRPERIVRQMRSEGVTTSSGSPAFYQRLADWALPRGERLELRGLWTGGAPVYPALAERLTRLVAGEAHVVYGSTEAEPIAGIEAGRMLQVMGDASWDGGICVGPPVPHIEVKVVRPTDGPIALTSSGWTEWELPRGETGEIVVTGRHVLSEYLDAPQDTARHKVREGARVWHRTGDAGRLDEEGRLWLMGRVGSRVVRDGQTWWSTPAEVRALRVEGVRHAAYLGIPDAEKGKRALLCVEADPAGFGREGVERLRLALDPTPVDDIRVVSRIPRDPRHASKTDTGRLLELLGYA